MGNRLSRIYTKTGDDGSTGLGDGTRVAKDSARVTAYGTIDEANSSIGLLLAVATFDPDGADGIRELLTTVQHQLFDLGGSCAFPAMPRFSMPISLRSNTQWTANAALRH